MKQLQLGTRLCLTVYYCLASAAYSQTKAEENCLVYQGEGSLIWTIHSGVRIMEVLL